MTATLSVTDFDKLAQISDLSQEHYDSAKQHYLSKGHSKKLLKLLRSRSKSATIRNLEYPSGEVYAPIYWTSDYLIKYIQKNSWGADQSLEAESESKSESKTRSEPTGCFSKAIATITVWDMLVLDIDSKDQLPYIKGRIDRYYPNELFYIHETPRGYHFYLVSKKLNHCSGAAIYMRMKLNTDVAHGSNSLYAGASIRLTRKSHEAPNTKISIFRESYGKGESDPDTLKIYQDVCTWIKRFSDPTMMTKEKLLYWYQQMPDNFGTVHVRAASTYSIGNTGLIPNLGFKFNSPELDKLWSRFIRYKCYKRYELIPLLACAQKQMAYGNLYRIFEATEDYAIGVHLQHNVHFISYRDLLYIDYDHPARLSIIARFARKHPETKFRVVRTTKGYHVFLTSHPMPHNNPRTLFMLYDLRTDPAHLLGVYHRGYSSRINQKSRSEKPYREVCTYGKGDECPRLLALYKKHLELYQKCVEDKTPICQYQKKRSMEIYRMEGPLAIF